MISVKEWAGVIIGMRADTAIKLHPNTEWVTEKPTILIDERSKNKKIPDLIVTWHYQDADLVIERATVNDPMFGKITAYAVQKILLKKDKEQDGYTKQHCHYKGKNRRKKGRKVRR